MATQEDPLTVAAIARDGRTAARGDAAAEADEDIQHLQAMQARQELQRLGYLWDSDSQPLQIRQVRQRL